MTTALTRFAAPAIALAMTGCSTTRQSASAPTPAIVAALQTWTELGRPERFTIETARGPAPAVLRAGVEEAWEPSDFEEFLAAESPGRRRFEVRATRGGSGTPLVGFQRNFQATPRERLFPPEGIVRPITATTRFHNGEFEITLHDPARTRVVDGKPLAADFSAPWEELVRRASRLGGSGIAAMLRSHGAGRRAGLFLMEPYDPGKTPLIMVHGLLSTPLTWAALTNDLLVDEEIRERYQIWHYFYPTGQPFLYSAMTFRGDLESARSLLDPTGHDPAMKRTVIIAHSMGGLLSKTLVQNSGDLLWRQVFNTYQLDVSADDARILRSIFHFEAQPHVDRIIFVATPHRGSDMARNWVGRAGDRLIRPDPAFRALYARVARDNPEALTPAFSRSLSRGELTSIDTLSPNHPILTVLSELPLHARAHSIIGDRGARGRLEHSSDGVVPYTSSHIASAESQLVVPADHGAFTHPDAIREIKRILKL